MRTRTSSSALWIGCWMCCAIGCASNTTDEADQADEAHEARDSNTVAQTRTEHDRAAEEPANGASNIQSDAGMLAGDIAQSIMRTVDAANSDDVSENFLDQSADGWQTLVVGKWEIDGGTESYRCVRFTLPRDLSVGAFRALSPAGTHHTLLTIVDDVKDPDGFSECQANTNGTREVAGSGVGTNDFAMPEGVAVQLKQGQQLLLNLHLFNVGDQPIQGVSGTLVKLVDEQAVKHTAEGVLAGTVMLDIPAGQLTTQHGTCTLTGDQTLVAIAPHMHQLGVHLKAVAHSSAMGDVTLIDRPYSFDEQVVLGLKHLVEMKKGDTIDVDCTYMNTTDHDVTFGQSSLSEMCFAGFYRYPVLGGSYGCTR